MRRFRFPLDSLLKIRKLEEKEAERKLQQAQARLRSAEEEMAQAESAYQNVISLWRQLLAGNADANELLLATQRLDLLERNKHLAAQKVFEFQQETDRCLEDYQDKRRKREIMEDLKTKAWHQWLTDLAKEQQNLADERALRDFAVSHINEEGRE